MTLSVVSVDGNALVRMGLAYALTGCPEVRIVGEAGTCAEARKLIAARHPAVVTVDAWLPDGDGIALATTVRRQHPKLGVVVLADADDETMFRAMRAGLSAFVSKSAPVDQIVAAVRHAAVAADSFTAPDLVDALSRRTSRRGTLSARETEVLQLLGDGLSLTKAAATMHVSDSTVKTYIARIYEKLGANNRAQALMTAIQRGLLTRARTLDDPDVGHRIAL